MPLKTLEEFNKKRIEEHRISAQNGIACPNCGTELYDSSPGVLLLSKPPQMRIACPKCEYQGFRVA